MHFQPRLLALCALLLSTALALPAAAANTAVPAALEITLGPDKFQRVTERVSGIDLDTDRKAVALAVEDVLVGEQHEGLSGFALDPELGTGKGHDFVYVAYAYDSGASGAGKDRRSRIVQYHWDAEAGTLGDPVDLFPDTPTAGPVAHN